MRGLVGWIPWALALHCTRHASTQRVSPYALDLSTMIRGQQQHIVCLGSLHVGTPPWCCYQCTRTHTHAHAHCIDDVITILLMWPVTVPVPVLACTPPPCFLVLHQRRLGLGLQSESRQPLCGQGEHLQTGTVQALPSHKLRFHQVSAPPSSLSSSHRPLAITSVA